MGSKKPLSETHPKLTSEANGWDPGDVTAGSGKKYSWKCEIGHVWDAVVASRSQGAGCPVCAGRRVEIGFNDMATTHPLMAQEAFGWDPAKVVAGTTKKLQWKCSKNHVWEVSGNSRLRGSGCPVCAGQKVAAGENDLQSLFPDLALEADGWDPQTVTVGNSKKVKWKCKHGHHWVTSTVNRTRRGDGCPVCSGRKILPGFNDLATKFPDLALEADGWDPSEVLRASNAKLSWKCSEGHAWKATVSSRLEGSGCPSCSGHRVTDGFNDLVTTHPGIAAEAEGWNPTQISKGSIKKLKWRCSNGHNYFMTVNNRTRGKGCPVCVGREVLIGFNDLATTNPEIAAQADNWDPTTLTAGSNLKRKWICSEGHRWLAVVSSRNIAEKGCPSCAKYGFDPGKDAWLYLARHPDWGLLQIGITNSPDTRLQRHSTRDWEIIDLRGPMEGSLSRKWEISILAMLKQKRMNSGSDKTPGGKFDGYTESWVEMKYKVGNLRELMDDVSKFEEKG